MLVFLEGLPASGKSTNSGFLYRQFERNGYSTRWIHEVSYPHPVVFFREASLTHTEMSDWLRRNPTEATIIEEIVLWRKDDVGIKLLELATKFESSIPEQARAELVEKDVHSFSNERYKDVAVSKWSNFLRGVEDNLESVYLLDGCIFQFQIFAFLLQDQPWDELRTFVASLWDMLEPFETKLIQFQRRSISDSLDFIRSVRGQGFFEHILMRDGSKPYYRNRGKTIQTVHQFFSDYNQLLDLLYADAPCPKLAVDVTCRDWKTYEQNMMDFVGLTGIPDVTPTSCFLGTFSCDGMELRVGLDDNQLYIADSFSRHTMHPRSDNRFYLGDLPAIIHFLNHDQIIVEGHATIHRWTQTQNIFARVDNAD